MPRIRQGKPMQVVVTLMGMCVTVGLLLFIPMSPPWPKALETLLYLLCLVLLFSLDSVRALVRILTPTQRTALVVLTGLLLFVQIKDRPQETFPFIAWNMYHARFPDPLEYLELVGVNTDGQSVEIPVGDVFASQRPRILLWQLLSLWKQMESAKDELTRQRCADQFQALSLAIIKRHQQQHPQLDLTRVRVMHCTLPRPRPGQQVVITRSLLREYTLASPGRA